MSWFGALFGGQNKDLNKQINKTGQIGDFATGLGMGNATAGSTWLRNINSGDTSKMTQAIAPEISAQQGQISQAKKQMAEFGSRSGGTAAAAANMGAQGRGNIINLLGGLQSGAANALLSSGNTLLGTGLNADTTSAQLSQERMDNWNNSIFGKALTTGAGFATGKILS